METLAERLDRGEVILLDGGTGTELERRGVPMDRAAWSARALVTHPGTVREVHEDYIRAGADMIITNSFSTARHQLEPADLGGRFGELNRLAVTLAREARENVASDRPVFVAGSISSIHFDPKFMVPVEQTAANFREQAEVLAEAGVDLIMMEMVWDIEYSSAAIRAALATGLPTWIGFSCRTGEGSAIVLWDNQTDTPFASALDILTALGGSAVNVMHTETKDIAPALRIVKDRWSGPFGAYAHSGEFVMPNWQFHDVISPEDYLTEAQKWVQMGAQIIGGCCGIGPEHIQLLRERLPSHVSTATRQ